MEIKPLYIRNFFKTLSNIRSKFEGFLLISAVFLIFINILQTDSLSGILHKKPITPNVSAMNQGYNVILISLDALRAQELPCYGYAKDTAPNMCKFAESNAIFQNTYSQSSFTLDSHISLMTSLYPTSHNMRVASKDVLNPSITTLAQVLSENGYKTVYLGPTNDPTLPLNKGFERGFTEIIDGDNDYNMLKGLIRGFKDTKTPTFIFFHTYDIHGPYFLPENYNNPVFAKNYAGYIPKNNKELKTVSWDFYKFIINELESRLPKSDTKESLERNQMLLKGLKDAKTLNEVRNFLDSNSDDDINFIYYWWYYKFVDTKDPQQIAHLESLYDEKIYITDKKMQEIFDLIDNLGLNNNTMIILTSDHGEEFQEHGKFDHVYNIYETETHIPWIMSVPGIKNFSSKEPTQSIDIFPTILGLLNIKNPDQVEGLNLASYIKGGAFPLADRAVISEHHNTSAKSIKFGSWRLYTEDPDYTPAELYKVDEDYLEQKNLIELYPNVADNLRSKLIDTLDNLKVYPQENEGFPDWIDNKQRQKLIEEGYF